MIVDKCRFCDYEVRFQLAEGAVETEEKTILDYHRNLIEQHMIDNHPDKYVKPTDLSNNQFSDE